MQILHILLLTASMFDWKSTINNLDSDGRDHMQYTNDAEKDIYIVYDLGDRQECWLLVSYLDSTLKEFCLNLSKTSEKGGRPQEYVYFITRQGVARPNVDGIHIWESTAIHRFMGYCQI